jgi:predicted MFS family arabinose efflux permease
MRDRQERARRHFAVRFGAACGVPFGAVVLQQGNWWWVWAFAFAMFVAAPVIYCVTTWRLMTAPALDDERRSDGGGGE